MDQGAQGFEREVEKEIQGIKNYRKFCIVVCCIIKERKEREVK
jgi:hypothetical protein